MNRGRTGGEAGSRGTVVAVLCLALFAAAGTPLGWWLTHRRDAVPTIGGGVAASLAAAAPTAALTAPPTGPPTAARGTAAAATAPTREGSQPPQGPPASARSPARTPPAGGAVAAPVRISIPSLDVRATVVPVGVDADGQMSLPENVGTVGWYRWSAVPGSAAGSVVVAGHVDSATQGEGALFELGSVRAGATVQLRSASGPSRTYRVVARQEYAKTALPVAQIFGRAGSPRLTLVTCGGVFDRARRSYESNVVVTAVPQ